MAHDFNKLAMSNSGQQYFSCLCAVQTVQSCGNSGESPRKIHEQLHKENKITGCI